MAIKGWRKERDTLTEITKERLIVIEQIDGNDHITIAENKEENNWFLFGKNIKRKNFKTKPKALKFARRYMKNH